MTFGWTAGIGGAENRNSGNDPRLAGINYSNPAPLTFQVDLPSADTYIVHLGLGDANGGLSSGSTATVKDDTTTVATISYRGDLTQSFVDATGTFYTNVTWPGSETGISLSFATTTLNLVLSGAGYVGIAHLAISQAAAGGAGQPTLRRFGGVPHMGTGGLKGGSGGGPWGQSKDDQLIIPRWLADQERQAA